ncbi:MAG: M23 family metallopeptidase [Sphingomonadaceae bacterium]|nr:M23 family metallopeptidase [Sphingomonadaceae bacterium]
MGSIETARADVGRNMVSVTRKVFRHLGAVLAASILLAGAWPTVAAARPAVRDAGDPEYRALFLELRDGEAPQRNEVAIPAGRPVAGANLTSLFGLRSDPFRGSAAIHTGIDLAAPTGTPVYATADGVVDRSEWNDSGYGNLIEIDHGQGIQTRYGHLSQRIAEPGQRVHRGDLIGLVGSTGRSTGSHLHYEVRVAGQAVDPIPFVPGGAVMMAAFEQRQQLAEGGPTSGSR